MPNENNAQAQENAKATQEQVPTPSTKEQIMALEQEIAESRNALDKGFAKKFGSSLSEEQQQLMFNDPVAFLESYESAKLKHLEQDLAPKLQRHTELRNQLNDESIQETMKIAEEKLLAKHPKANAKAVMEFMEHDLTKRQQAELMQLDPTDRLLAAYELMPQSKGKELPQELNDLHDDGSLDNEENEFMNRR